MSSVVLDSPTDLDDALNSIFEESNNIKTEVSIVTYDENQNKLQSDFSEYTLKMSREAIEDEKLLNKFIKKCEALIRTSPEYSDWTDYIRNVMEMTECQITGEAHSQAKSDIHHHPFCLYTLVKGVILKRVINEKEFTSMEIMTEVLDMHYKMKAPFIVLLKSIHEKYHNGFINLPMELVQGDKNYFIKEYGGFLDVEDLDPIVEKMKINWTNCGYSQTKYRWN